MPKCTTKTETDIAYRYILESTSIGICLWLVVGSILVWFLNCECKPNRIEVEANRKETLLVEFKARHVSYTWCAGAAAALEQIHTLLQ